MIVGHYATALVAKGRVPQGPLWLYLLASQLQDFAMLILVALGIESLGSGSFIEFSYKHSPTDMVWSHDLVPSLFWAVAMAGFAWVITRSRAIALVCGILVVGHEVSDLIAGFPHQIAGHGTPVIGLHLYTAAPELAFFLEMLLGIACVAYFIKARRDQNLPLSRGQQIGLFLFVLIPPLSSLPQGSQSLSDLLSG
ncbi:MAG: hypothetical protein AAGD01_09320 [Acidobacteriota bacterium]